MWKAATSSTVTVRKRTSVSRPLPSCGLLRSVSSLPAYCTALAEPFARTRATVDGNRDGADSLVLGGAALLATTPMALLAKRLLSKLRGFVSPPVHVALCHWDSTASVVLSLPLSLAASLKVQQQLQSPCVRSLGTAGNHTPRSSNLPELTRHDLGHVSAYLPLNVPSHVLWGLYTHHHSSDYLSLACAESRHIHKDAGCFHRWSSPLVNVSTIPTLFRYSNNTNIM